MDNPLAGLDLRHVYWWLGLFGSLWAGQTFLRQEPSTLVVTSADFVPGWIGSDSLPFSKTSK